MTFITLISLIIFSILLISFIAVKLINRKKLDSIRGAGDVYTKGTREKLPYYKNEGK